MVREISIDKGFGILKLLCMGLSLNVIWHQTSLEALLNILNTKKFLCAYSLETIKWRKSELSVAFPMVSFCDLPLSDMSEFLTHNDSREYRGKYGECSIGINYEWSIKLGMTHVWYHSDTSGFLNEALKDKNEVLKSLLSNNKFAKWELLSRTKPFKGNLETKGFKDYRFYDEKEIRYIPHHHLLFSNGISHVLSKNDYYRYKQQRIPYSLNKKNGDSLIPKIGIKFEYKDIRYILVYNQTDIERISSIIGNNSSNITYLTYKQVIEDIIGMNHYVNFPIRSATVIFLTPPPGKAARRGG